MPYQKIVATGVLRVGGRVLMIRRAPHEEFLPNALEFPGGKVDFGETVEEAIEREYREETNLNVEIGRFLRTFAYVSDHGQRHTVELVFEVTLCPESSLDSIELDEDHTEHVLVPIDEALGTLTDEELVATLRALETD